MGPQPPQTDPWHGLAELCRQLAPPPSHRDPPELAARVAQFLRAAAPGSRLSGCVVHDGGSAAVHLLDEAGQPQSLKEAQIATLLGRDGSEAVAGGEEIPVPGQVLLTEPIVWQTARLGSLVLAVGAEPSNPESALRDLLAVCAAVVAPHLAGTGGADKDEQACTEELANMGELARPLTHTFNNFLNGLVLKAAVLEQQLPESFRPALGQLRQQATDVADQIKRFQQYRQKVEPAGARADVNRAVREAVALVRANRDEATRGDPVLTEDYGPDVSGVAGSGSELRRCVFFLLANAERVCRKGKVVVRTTRTATTVQIHVEDEGPGVDPAQLGKLFELGPVVRPGTQPLELAACRSIVRRLGGKLRAENTPGGGLAVLIDLPNASR